MLIDSGELGSFSNFLFGILIEPLVLSFSRASYCCMRSFSLETTSTLGRSAYCMLNIWSIAFGSFKRTTSIYTGLTEVRALINGRLLMYIAQTLFQNLSKLIAFVTKHVTCCVCLRPTLTILDALTGHQTGPARERRAPKLAIDYHILNVLSLHHQLCNLFGLLLGILLCNFLKR